jgi:hypothetical protein
MAAMIVSPVDAMVFESLGSDKSSAVQYAAARAVCKLSLCDEPATAIMTGPSASVHLGAAGRHGEFRRHATGLLVQRNSGRRPGSPARWLVQARVQLPDAAVAGGPVAVSRQPSAVSREEVAGYGKWRIQAGGEKPKTEN